MSLNFHDGSIWERNSIKGILASEARRAAWGMEPLDAMAHVWLVLTSRFPTGDVPGDHPDAYLGKTIRFEARKHFARERRASPNTRDDLGSILDDASRREAGAERAAVVERLLSYLRESDRELISLLFGLNGEPVPVRVLAERFGRSVQSIYKRKDRILGTLRRRAEELGIEPEPRDDHE